MLTAPPSAGQKDALMPQPDYLGFRDLLARWVYTRPALYAVLRWPDFPAPAFVINAGRTKIWRVADIAEFEKQHPELLSTAARDWKTKGYLLSMMRAEARRRRSQGGE